MLNLTFEKREFKAQVPQERRKSPYTEIDDAIIMVIKCIYPTGMLLKIHSFIYRNSVSAKCNAPKYFSGWKFFDHVDRSCLSAVSNQHDQDAPIVLAWSALNHMCWSISRINAYPEGEKVIFFRLMPRARFQPIDFFSVTDQTRTFLNIPFLFIFLFPFSSLLPLFSFSFFFSPISIISSIF